MLLDDGVVWSAAGAQVRSCKPGDAISIIETDCQVDFEAPKDYKEPTPVAAAQRSSAATPAAAAVGSGTPGSGGGDQAAATEEEEEQPKFVAFAGSGRRLDGKPASNGTASSSNGAGSSSAAAAAAAARASAAAGSTSSGSTAVTGSSKPGTFVSTGNRLLDKLQMDKVSQPSPTAASLM
jgi:ubiquitin fusion degradation protein 1